MVETNNYKKRYDILSENFIYMSSFKIKIVV